MAFSAVCRGAPSGISAPSAAASSAFSPAASALVARLDPAAEHGRAFRSYGFYKSIGYTLGPLLGGVLVWIGGFRLLFAVMAVLGVWSRCGRCWPCPPCRRCRGPGRPCWIWPGG
jgi:MFS family permease